MFAACVAVAGPLVDACLEELAVAAVHRLLFDVKGLGEIERLSGVECVDACG